MDTAIPRYILWTGLAALASVWLLGARLAWEQTVWTWESGPQLVGYSLAYTGTGVLLILCVLTSLAWPLVVIVTAAWRRRFGPPVLWAMVAAYGLAWVVILMPYGVWQRLFIDKFSQPQAVELLTYAAAQGDRATIDAFLGTGLAVNAQGKIGTALHAAAIRGQLDTMRYLLKKGADVNAINTFGDSPMENAGHALEHSAEALALLAAHGGKRVRGSDEQRKSALERQMQENIQQMKTLAPQ